MITQQKKPLELFEEEQELLERVKTSRKKGLVFNKKKVTKREMDEFMLDEEEDDDSEDV